MNSWPKMILLLSTSIQRCFTHLINILMNNIQFRIRRLSFLYFFTHLELKWIMGQDFLWVIHRILQCLYFSIIEKTKSINFHSFINHCSLLYFPDEVCDGINIDGTFIIQDIFSLFNDWCIWNITCYNNLNMISSYNL